VSSFARGRIVGWCGGVEAVRGASATVDGPEIVKGPLSFHRRPLTVVVQVVVWDPSQGAAEGGPRQDGHCWTMGRGVVTGESG
jgi:hypothetical protein